MISKWIKIVVVVTVVITAVVSYTVFRASPDTLSNFEPDYIVESAVLVNAFAANEKAANAIYLDKVVQVTGKVVDVEKSTTDKTSISLQGDIMGNVSCLIPNKQLQGVKLRNGMILTLKGRCTGYILDVVLIKCALVD